MRSPRRPSLPVAVGTALALVLGSGVATAVGQAAGPADRPAPLAAEGVAGPSPLAELALEPLAEAADRTRVSPPAPAVPAVAPLDGLHVADLQVALPATLTADQVAALLAVPGVAALSAYDVRTVAFGAGTVQVAGVDPSDFRAFTPQETAASDALWQAVARGELAPSHAVARGLALPLGGDAVLGTPAVQARVGAVASYGLPGVDVVTSRAAAARLVEPATTGLLIAAPDRTAKALRRDVRAVLGDVDVQVLRPEPVAARKGRPASYRELYVDSARYCPGLDWTVLAAIGQVESAHGRHLGPSSAGALGPMQFLPSTWAAYGVDGDSDGRADIMSPFDAVPSAARYLCRFGANRGPEGLYDAIFAYNHADWYVKKVLATAEAYR